MAITAMSGCAVSKIGRSEPEQTVDHAVRQRTRPKAFKRDLFGRRQSLVDAVLDLLGKNPS